MKFVAAFCIASCLVSLALSAAISRHRKPLNPDHVPSTVCETMVPCHSNNKPSTDPTPYTITPSQTYAIAGVPIRVVVTGMNDARFKGLYMQAREVDGNSRALGKFSMRNQEINPAVRVKSCPPGSENAVSYVSRDDIGTLTIEWTAPEFFSGNIYFRSTMFESFSKFWVGVSSAPVTIYSSASSYLESHWHTVPNHVWMK